MKRNAMMLTPLLLLLIWSCKGNLEKYGEDFATLMRSPHGLFRDCELGDSPDRVRQNEGTAPAASSDNSLSYEGRLNETADYLIQYGFENQKLYEILVEVNFQNPAEGTTLLKGCRDFFNARYGNYSSGNGYMVWAAHSGGAKARIEMVDENQLSDFGQFSLNFYKENPETGENPNL
jgi:hypothetical protein